VPSVCCTTSGRGDGGRMSAASSRCTLTPCVRGSKSIARANRRISSARERANCTAGRRGRTGVAQAASVAMTAAISNETGTHHLPRWSGARARHLRHQGHVVAGLLYAWLRHKRMKLLRLPVAQLCERPKISRNSGGRPKIPPKMLHSKTCCRVPAETVESSPLKPGRCPWRRA